MRKEIYIYIYIFNQFIWKNLSVLGKLYGRTDLSSSYHRLRLPSLTHFYIRIPKKVSQLCKSAIYIMCHFMQNENTYAQPRANGHSVTKVIIECFHFRIMAKYCCKSLGLPEFNIGRNSLYLIYSQTLVWYVLYLSTDIKSVPSWGKERSMISHLHNTNLTSWFSSFWQSCSTLMTVSIIR